ncbi:hypothetical protein F0240_19795 [Vibrio kanaloae]|uniref:hypothetical protein n=1 Tax=Vibrio kanaloae TaxID=170673 RepID=UPI00148B8051|nr:hypothetical protein [Vibrio kanaloae]NOJ02043.1 hypothetical protein [Vibrio kanaloae]
MRRYQSGALTLWLATALLSLVIFTSVAIDTARLAFQRQQLQSIADLSASEIGLNNPYFIQPEAVENWEAILTDKYQQQVDDIVIQNGYALIQDNRWIFNPSPSAATDGYPATKVVATKTVPQSMIAGGLFNDNKITLMAESAIQKAGIISFGIGSKTLETTESSILNGLLSGLLGIDINLTAASYQGLANTSLKLGSVLDTLALDLGLGSPQEVLESDISLLTVLDTYLNILDRGDSSTDGLNVIIDQLVLATAIPDIVLGDILKLTETSTQGAALETSLNALKLIKATIFASNKEHFVDIPDLSVVIPSVTSIELRTQIIEAPQYTIATLPISENAPPSVSNSQIELQLAADLDLVDDITGALSTLTPTGIDISPLVINVSATKATATLTHLDLNQDNPEAEFIIQDSLLTMDADPIEISIDLPLFSAIEITINIDIEDNRDWSATHIALDELPYSSEESDNILADSGRAFTTAINLDIDAPLGLGYLLTPISNALSPAILSLLTAILGQALLPTLQALGVPLGGADLWVDSVQASSHGLIL